MYVRERCFGSTMRKVSGTIDLHNRVWTLVKDTYFKMEIQQWDSLRVKLLCSLGGFLLQTKKRVRKVSHLHKCRDVVGCLQCMHPSKP